MSGKVVFDLAHIKKALFLRLVFSIYLKLSVKL